MTAYSSPIRKLKELTGILAEIQHSVDHIVAKKPIPQESKDRMSAAWKGKKRPPFSAEHRRKLSVARSKQVSPMKGKHLSEDHRAKIRLSMLGSSNRRNARREAAIQ